MAQPTIRRGNIGQSVISWQHIMNRDFGGSVAPPAVWTNTRGQARTWVGGRFHPLKLDGVFGAGTELATEAWQHVHGLAADGIVGPQTWFVALGGGNFAGPPPLLHGADLSAMQGALTAKDWLALRERGLRFVILRACVGNESWIDTRAGANLVGARDAGLAVGLYCFSYPLRHIDPRVQVEQWVKRCEVAAIDPGAVLWALDLEWPPREEWRVVNGTRTLAYPWKEWGVDARSIAEWNLVALERGREIIGTPWLRYSFRYFLECIEAHRYGGFADGPLWLADYWAAGRWPTAEEAAARRVPGPWSEITILQHDGNGGLRLPNGVDADFNVLQGGEEALRALFPVAPPAIDDIDERVALARPDVPNMLTIREHQIATYRRERLVAAA